MSKYITNVYKIVRWSVGVGGASLVWLWVARTVG